MVSAAGGEQKKSRPKAGTGGGGETKRATGKQTRWFAFL